MAVTIQHEGPLRIDHIVFTDAVGLYDSYFAIVCVDCEMNAKRKHRVDAQDLFDRHHC